MSPSEVPVYYKLYAHNCVEIAQRTSDPGTKATLLTMAQAWLVLADRVERAGGAVIQQQPEPKG
jgi:hypothetical protein